MVKTKLLDRVNNFANKNVEQLNIFKDGDPIQLFAYMGPNIYIADETFKYIKECIEKKINFNWAIGISFNVLPQEVSFRKVKDSYAVQVKGVINAKQ